LGKNTNAPLVLLSLAALTAAVALFAFYLFSRPPGDGSVEAGFARDMSVHHSQAVEMAEIVRDKTESEEIRTLAKDIALTQQGQMGQMRGWLDVWGLSPTGSEPAMAWMGHPTEGRMQGMASTEELERLTEASPEEADRLFLQLMIPHHEAAVPMAEAALERSDNPEVERLAEAITASQKGEIKVMETMLRERGEEPPAEDSHSHSMEGM
jgi:uncharacterized protein (DUF305 family)